MDDNKRDIYSQIIKYTGIFGSIQGLSILTGVVRNKAIALLLGTQGMGLMSLLSTTVSFMSQATNLGLSFSGVREIAACKEKGDMEGIGRCAAIIRAWSLVAALIGAVVCAVTCKWIDKLTFTWGDHSLHYLLLSPAIAIMAVTAGETAILKGLHRLKALAVAQLITAVGALVITIPLLYFFGEAAIVPMLTLTALTTMLVTIAYSYSTVRPQWPQWRKWRATLLEGGPMVRLGLAFVAAAIMGSGTELVIRAYLNVRGDLDVVGLYNAGYMLAVTYAGMFFSSMESDYYPRLSAVNGDMRKVNELVGYQTEVSLTLVAPMMCVFILSLPVIVPLLFSSKFNAAIPMAQAMALTMMCKAVSLPVNYVMLAKGDSRLYVCLEGLSYVMTISGVVIGYNCGGLVGTGIGLAIAYAVELAVNCLCLHIRYGLTLHGRLLAYFAILLAMVITVYASTYLHDTALRWGIGIGMTAMCSAYSLRALKSNLRH